MGSHASADAALVMEALRRLVRFLHLGTRAAEATTGLGSAQLFVLERLADSPAPSIAELASRTLTDASSVSTVVAKLVERGYVKRKPSPTDRRRTSIALTAAGRALVTRAPELSQVRLLEALDEMSARDRRALARTLGSWVRAAGAERLEPRMFFEDEVKRAEPARKRRS